MCLKWHDHLLNWCLCMHTQKDLYEVAFAKGRMTAPFVICSGMPRKEIPMSSTNLSELSGSVLTVEVKDGDEADLLDQLHGIQVVTIGIAVATVYLAMFSLIS